MQHPNLVTALNFCKDNLPNHALLSWALFMSSNYRNMLQEHAVHVVDKRHIEIDLYGAQFSMFIQQLTMKPLLKRQSICDKKNCPERKCEVTVSLLSQ